MAFLKEKPDKRESGLKSVCCSCVLIIAFSTIKRMYKYFYKKADLLSNKMNSLKHTDFETYVYYFYRLLSVKFN